MKQVTKWIRHNQGLFAALVICGGLLAWTFGCQSKVTSLVDDTKKVTAEELNLEIEAETNRLQAELDSLIKRAKLKQAELARQDAIKAKLFEFASITAGSGSFNPAGLLALTGGLLGFGAMVDNRIKDKVIKNRPLNKSGPA